MTDLDCTLYEVLGVSQTATASEIHSAYRKRTLAVHPDKGGSREAFIDVAHAFEKLSSAQSRAAYDEQLLRKPKIGHVLRDVDACTRTLKRRRSGPGGAALPTKLVAQTSSPTRKTTSCKSPQTKSPNTKNLTSGLSSTQANTTSISNHLGLSPMPDETGEDTIVTGVPSVQRRIVAEAITAPILAPVPKGRGRMTATTRQMQEGMPKKIVMDMLIDALGQLRDAVTELPRDKREQTFQTMPRIVKDELFRFMQTRRGTRPETTADDSPNAGIVKQSYRATPLQDNGSDDNIVQPPSRPSMPDATCRRNLRICVNGGKGLKEATVNSDPQGCSATRVAAAAHTVERALESLSRILDMELHQERLCRDARWRWIRDPERTMHDILADPPT